MRVVYILSDRSEILAITSNGKAIYDTLKELKLQLEISYLMSYSKFMELLGSRMRAAIPNRKGRYYTVTKMPVFRNIISSKKFFKQQSFPYGNS